MTTTGLSFSARLRAASWSDHSDAESGRYIAALTSGALPLPAYTDLVAQHHLVYEALEGVAETMRADPVAGPFVDDALTRLPALTADLEFLLGPDWANLVTATPATVAYVARIREVGTDPARFVAHHYTRYLGDLSGGIFIGRAIGRAYDLGSGPGASFYRFDEIPDPKAYKDGYRTRLDALADALDETGLTSLVDEVLLAYRHNTALFTDLSHHVPAAPL